MTVRQHYVKKFWLTDHGTWMIAKCACGVKISSAWDDFFTIFEDHQNNE